mgnify:CR=1 FL=1
MITKFETKGSSAPQSGGSSANGLLYLLIGAAALYFAYQYMNKTETEKKEDQPKT